ncbi:hypothetical protein [Trinickia dinghuensis]|uniref:Uncharacterized protein n=1 Tax=Trinickia dinghuensis TaxID=2291023 RepID=A0A3D8K2P0_9BURK|nr:hypothetical protein [Trinickia dinghuensis]RDU99430.1 hypothetical protein DWV00_09775 [Trinickia dinghuensis]
MQTHHAFHPELRHATVPTYVVSYLFPVLIVIYEIYRVGYWISQFGMNFAEFNQTGYEYVLMLAVFAVQVVVGVLFIAIVLPTRHPDLEHRLTNIALGLFCSAVVLGYDYFALQGAL